MSKEQVMGVVRHVLTFGGGFVIAKGWASEADIATAVAALVSLVGVVWSFFDKK